MPAAKRTTPDPLAEQIASFQTELKALMGTLLAEEAEAEGDRAETLNAMFALVVSVDRRLKLMAKKLA